MRIESIALMAVAFPAAAPVIAQSKAVASPPDYVQAYDAAFRAAFRKNTIEQCIVSAKSSAYFDLTPTCSCLADTLLAMKTVGELSRLAADEKLKSELQPITMQCIQTAPPIRK
jgi:hypothetical protein